MITPFPLPRSPQPDPLGWVLALHTEETPQEHEEGLAWVRWLFQSVRIRCPRLAFESHARDRSALLAGWEHFAQSCFLPILAPALLDAWRSGQDGDDARLAASDLHWASQLSPENRKCSLAAGHILLEKTKGAKYQGALGRLRGRIAAGEAEGHLTTVWGALAALFQLPPVDLLSEYLREEWMVGTAAKKHKEEPQGALSFAGLSQKALHQVLGGAVGAISHSAGREARRDATDSR